jgi:antitoxin ChpS
VQGAKASEAKSGDAFEPPRVTGDIAALRVVRPRYKLADLLAQCDPDAPPPRLDEWDHMKPAGQEVG